ncbi:unnamed protein product [Brachionus calyciflorus]|uniref:Uncharacterized protein n=1 Tax=Brachionus calyciflorus TaxID=104777 RepID=A0A813UDF4_9BILA|nr:unnamed protein product [Brachionus calyciflorus]
MFKDVQVDYQEPNDQNNYNFGYDSDTNKANTTNRKFKSNDTNLSNDNALLNTPKSKNSPKHTNNSKLKKADSTDSTKNESLLKTSKKAEKEDAPSKINSDQSIKKLTKINNLSRDSSSPAPDYVLDRNQGLNQNKKNNLKEDNSLKTNLQVVEARNKKYNVKMKSKNNQSSFAKNPTQSYSDQYYASFPAGYKLPRGGVLPLMDPYVGAPIPPYLPPYGAPFIPPYPYPNMYNPYYKNPVFYAKKGSPRDLNYFNPTLPYNYWARPGFYDDKDPSIHDLLYYDKFKNQDASYQNKHVEKKIRAIDGYYNPYGEYTVQDYKNFKTGKNIKDDNKEKIERINKVKEIGNNFMKKKTSNPNKRDVESDNEQPRQKINGKLAQSDTDLPKIKNQNKINANNNLTHNPYLNNYNNNNYNYNSLSNNQINHPKNYESFDFLSSNDEYGMNNINNNYNNQNKNLDAYNSLRYQVDNDLAMNNNLNQGFKGEKNDNNQNNGKYFKNPKFDFSNKNQPADPNHNPRARALQYAKGKNL